MTLREFVGEEFFKWAVLQYEEARHFLKHCGRPENDGDIFLIQEARWKASYYSRYVK